MIHDIGDQGAPTRALTFVYDFEPSLGDFRVDILAGLKATPKATSPKYFYDARGSALFDAITEAPEYYVTRTEVALLRRAAPEIADIVGARAGVFELGSGSSLKIRLLLDALDRPAVYVAQDISHEHLIAAAGSVAGDYPELTVGVVCSDFTERLPMADDLFPGAEGRVSFFPGSTIGNFEPHDAAAIWRATRALLHPGDWFVLGADLVKDVATLKAAYDDAAGVTAAFNINLLHRINAELDGDLDVSRFTHQALWNDGLKRIEMHLRSDVDQTFHVAGEAFAMTEGETIHTESSHKFTQASIADQAGAAGFVIEQSWVDQDAPFGVFLLRAV